MEITAENVSRIYSLPRPDLRTYLPKVFAKLSAPADDDAHLVETYVKQLADRFGERARHGAAAGWDAFQQACVEAGVLEALLALVQHPRDDAPKAVYYAWDALVWLSAAANVAQRRRLGERAAACGAMKICLQEMKNGRLCSHRYGAVRFLRSICVESTVCDNMSASDLGEVLETILRYALEETESYSQELAEPNKSWQVNYMTNIRRTPPAAACQYGKRWFCVAQESILFSAQGLLCCDPPRTAQYRAGLLESHPAIIDLLLDIALLPRPACYAETQRDELALEVLTLLIQLPFQMIPGLEAPLEGQMKTEWDEYWQATLRCIEALVAKPSLIARFLAIWKKLDDEKLSAIERMLSNQQRDWHTSPPDDDTLTKIYESRGTARISLLQLMVAATYSPNFTTGDALSLLRPTYLATKTCAPLAADATLPNSDAEFYELTERTVLTFRVPVNAAAGNIEMDAPSQVAPAAVLAPTALLRLLTLLAAHGALAQTAAWTALPPGAAPGTALAQVQQITSAAVVPKLLALIGKRAAAQRNRAGASVSEGDYYFARFKYRVGALLAHALVEFDRACDGLWRASVRGAKKELVLGLGDVAEMSLKVHDYKAALAYALAAQEVARGAAGVEDITAEMKTRNMRRIQAAKRNL